MTIWENVDRFKEIFPEGAAKKNGDSLLPDTVDVTVAEADLQPASRIGRILWIG